MVLGSSPVAVTSPSDFVPASSKEVLDVEATIENGFTLKRARNTTRIYSQYPMKWFPKRPIYIKTNFFLYLLECNVVRINVLTLEFCLKIVIRNGKTSFCFYDYGTRIIYEIERNVYNQHWIANCSMKCYLNSVTYAKRFSYLNWIGSSRN